MDTESGVESRDSDAAAGEKQFEADHEISSSSPPPAPLRDEILNRIQRLRDSDMTPPDYDPDWD